MHSPRSLLRGSGWATDTQTRGKGRGAYRLVVLGQYWKRGLREGGVKMVGGREREEGLTDKIKP